MSLVIEEVKSESKGLDNLIKLVQRGTRIASLTPWLEAAYEQLEKDDSIDPQRADELADILDEAEHAASTKDLNAQLRRLCEVYLQVPPLEQVWLAKARNLSQEELLTETWLELHQAVEAAHMGNVKLAQEWVTDLSELYLDVWKGYETTTVLEAEITQESALGHQFLQGGVESWLEALAAFQSELESASPDYSRVFEPAEWGQRLLLVVQAIEEENRRNAEFYFSHLN